MSNFHDLDDVFDALRGPAMPAELADEANSVDLMANAHLATKGKPMHSVSRRTRFATLIAAGVIGFGGVAAASPDMGLPGDDFEEMFADVQTQLEDGQDAVPSTDDEGAVGSDDNTGVAGEGDDGSSDPDAGDVADGDSTDGDVDDTDGAEDPEVQPEEPAEGGEESPEPSDEASAGEDEGVEEDEAAEEGRRGDDPRGDDCGDRGDLRRR